MAEALRGKFTGIDLDEVVDWPVVRTWLYWGMFWLIVTPSIGVALSSLFNFPDYLGPHPPSGRLRPVHVNGVIFGAFSTLFIGECYYLFRACAACRYGGEDGASRSLGCGALLAGSSRCRSATTTGSRLASSTSTQDPLSSWWRHIAQFLVTIARRLETPLYVAVWYLIATFVWTTMNLVLGTFILPYTISGINSAAFHGLYLHYIVGLWITPAGYVLIYYFLPISLRSLLFAHKLSLVGFWSLAVFYPSSASTTISSARSPTGPRRSRSPPPCC